MPVRAVLLFLLTVASAAPAQSAAPLTPRAMTGAELAVIINDADPSSVEVGAYYVRLRDIPPANVVHVSIPGKPQRLDPAAFARLRQHIDSRLGPHIQAVLMVWTAPFAVGCNGITAAYTMGYDAAQCRQTCAAGRPSNYYNASTARPFSEFGMRLSMLLPTESVSEAKALIERGTASGFRLLPATAYYLATSQLARNARARFFPRPAVLPAKKLTVSRMYADALEGASDILIYQTGMASVPKLDTLRFVPGALADHLTSFGGELLGSSQMSSLRWLQAGATASYGTVSEPCNHWQKFPQPSVLLKHYVGGSTAIEAYWRSVAWPAQGVFIGEPLAAPYRRQPAGAEREH